MGKSSIHTGLLFELFLHRAEVVVPSALPLFFLGFAGSCTVVCARITLSPALMNLLFVITGTIAAHEEVVPERWHVSSTQFQRHVQPSTDVT